jgi:hypothetical protein
MACGETPRWQLQSFAARGILWRFAAPATLRSPARHAFDTFAADLRKTHKKSPVPWAIAPWGRG